MNRQWIISIGGLAACGVGLLAAGCASTALQREAPEEGAAAEASLRTATGRPAADLVAEAKASGARCEFFTPDSQRLAGLPAGAAGSVSIHAADGSGQDNYTFGADGKVTRHQRSYGADYGAGVWTDVP